MPKIKGILLLSSLGIQVKKLNTQLLSFGGIYLFTNRVVTHFGSIFFKISRDFTALVLGMT